MLQLTELFRQSRLNNREEYATKEIAKRGILRAGSSGIISEKGEVAGNCVRKSHLRSVGIEIDPPTEDKLIMFDLGYASEDIVYKKLVSALPAEQYTVLREEEIPIQWNTSNGITVSGRPDIVICKVANNKQEVRPVLGLELKSVHSVWVAREVLFNRKPKLGNVIQAAHYMWKLGIPYKLVYTGYSQLGQGMAGEDTWASKLFPRMGEPGSEFISYNEQKGTIKHIKQFEVVYDLQFDEAGRLCYKLEEEDPSEWTRTIVTRDSIEKYFEFVSRMEIDEDLGPRPSQIDTVGKKAGYKDCDFCPIRSTCDSHEKKGYKEWMSQVKLVLVKNMEENAVVSNEGIDK